MAIHLVQLSKGDARHAAVVKDNTLQILSDVRSVYDIAQQALRAGKTLTACVHEMRIATEVQYDPVYRGESEWQLLPPVDVPGQPARTHVSGTGLTHLGSARSRQAMHAAPKVEAEPETMTDSMKMFQWGIDGGRPGEGRVGIAPEWFYKGNATLLRGHGQPLEIPFYAEDGGEEAEVAAAYIIGDDGTPLRLGLMPGNELSDHVFERKNYLNLAGSKLRTCGVGPELVLTDDFHHLQGRVEIERDGEPLWSSVVETGEDTMSHSLQNLEHHHFKFEVHRVPGDLHVHFFGTSVLSFSNGIVLRDGDVATVGFPDLGRPLRNPIRRAEPDADKLIRVRSIA